MEPTITTVKGRFAQEPQTTKAQLMQRALG